MDEEEWLNFVDPQPTLLARNLCVVLHLGHKWEAFKNARAYAPEGQPTHWCNNCGYRDWRPGQA